MIHDTGGTLKIADSLFVNNSATSVSSIKASVLRLFDSSLILSNNTMVSSTAQAAYGIAAFRSNVVISNSLFANYTLGTLTDVSTTLSFDYNMFLNELPPASGMDGGHNQVNDPRFVNPAAGDFHLRLDSPALDAGQDAAALLFGSFDLDGVPRFTDIPGVGALISGMPQKVDMGAYEAQNETSCQSLHR